MSIMAYTISRKQVAFPYLQQTTGPHPAAVQLFWFGVAVLQFKLIWFGKVDFHSMFKIPPNPGCGILILFV